MVSDDQPAYMPAHGAAQDSQNSNSGGASTGPPRKTRSHPGSRWRRAPRACETCRARKVRCDAASLGVPCTNCSAFCITCVIPTPERKKPQAGKQKDSDSDRGDAGEYSSPRGMSPSTQNAPGIKPCGASSDGALTLSPTDALPNRDGADALYPQLMKPKLTRAPIKHAGRVAYMGESSNLTLLVHDRYSTADVVHYPLPENIRGSWARLSELDSMEIDILHQRGAFLLPPKSLCDELVDSYFKWVAPIVPVINRSRFMRQYQDAENPPSLLLLQAILLAGSRVCTNPQLMDVNGSTTPAALIFCKRAKALYDANYECDRVTIVQALVLMGWYWEGPEDVTMNVFYWSGVATVVAQASGMHRSMEGSQLSVTDRRLWKRIWWTLFTRDRSVAVALGRPVHINTDDSDLEMVSEDDFIEDDDPNSEYAQNPLHVQFFLQYVKLCEIMGRVLLEQYPGASKARRQNAIDLTHNDMALADWLQNCPKEVSWEMSRHHFWAALLHSNYYTAVCLLHRADMLRVSGRIEKNSYPSRNIAYQAAAMITSIVGNLSAHDELRYCPAFIVYSLFSALVIHVYQMRSHTLSVRATQKRMRVCMNALKDVSQVWLVAKMVYTLFEAIRGNKVLGERLQKAPGKRHKKMTRGLGASQIKRQKPGKRKYDDISGVTLGPAPQEPSERSRPQTPSATPTHELPQIAPVRGEPGTSSPNAKQNTGTFLGDTNSRPRSAPATPLSPSFSVAPSFYPVTHNSPDLLQTFWKNFQPGQHSPEGSASMQHTQFSPPPPAAQNLDPNLIPQMAAPQQQQVPIFGQSPHSSREGGMRARTEMGGSPVQGQAGMPNPEDMGYQVQQSMLQPVFGQALPNAQCHSPSDTWSNGSAPPVPNLVDAEVWFRFFGINGELSGMNNDARLG